MEIFDITSLWHLQIFHLVALEFKTDFLFIQTMCVSHGLGNTGFAVDNFNETYHMCFTWV